MNRRTFFALGAAGTGAALAAVAPSLSAPARTRPVFHQSGAEWFTNARLQTHEGRTVRFYDDLMRDKIVLINFVFTGCAATCPTQTRELAALQRSLPASLRRDVRFVSISVDPLGDTPALLRAYGSSAGADFSSWTFATGRPQDIEWAIDRGLPEGENLLLLQSRPETVWASKANEKAPTTSGFGIASITQSLMAQIGR